MQLVFLCSEYEGLIKTGGLADATRGLCQALQQQGHQVLVMLPRYGSLYDLPVSQQFDSVYFELAGHPYGCAIRHYQQDGVNIALVEHHDFFQRQRPYDDGEHAYPDNALRFGFFCKAALSYLQQRTVPVDVIHGHDWQAALAACYLKEMHSGALAQSRFVLTIHNAAYQQIIARHELASLGLGHWQLPPNLPLSLLAFGIWQADKLNTVSQGYRQELLSEPAANGLAALYQQRSDDFIGILNGCDYQRWNPATDLSLVAQYDQPDLAGKLLCKRELQRQTGLAASDEPLLVMVSRVTAQKGFTYLIPALQQFLAQQSVQVVIMGTGEQQFMQPLKQLMQQFPTKFRLLEGFDEPLSHQVEAAGDFFLMPSLFEPCGLNQIYSLRYGTVPIVRATGGLRDTVVGLPARGATGISFEQPSAEDLLPALVAAVALYNNKKQYRSIQKRGMSQQFSWAQAAQVYLKMYQSL